MNEFKQNLVIAILVLTFACLGIVTYSAWKIYKVVDKAEQIFMDESKVLAKEAGTYLKEEYSDDLKELSKEQVDSVKSKLNQLWNN